MRTDRLTEELRQNGKQPESRDRFQFRIRTLSVAILLIAVLLGLLKSEVGLGVEFLLWLMLPPGLFLAAFRFGFKQRRLVPGWLAGATSLISVATSIYILWLLHRWAWIWDDNHPGPVQDWPYPDIALWKASAWLDGIRSKHSALIYQENIRDLLVYAFITLAIPAGYGAGAFLKVYGRSISNALGSK